MGWAISAKKNVILLAILLLVTLEYCHGDDDLVYEPDCLNVPTAEFLSSVKTTIDVVQQVTSIVAGFNRGFHDFRTSHAISDCLDLLDLSTDELVSTLSLIQHPHNSNTSFFISALHFHIFFYKCMLICLTN